MFDFLLYSGMACTDAADIISRVQANDNLDIIVRTEVVETIKESTPKCNWDAND